MIRIGISIEAFEALAATLPLGSVAYEAEANQQGERYVWLKERWVSKLAALRMPEERYSAAIVRLLASEPRSF